MGACLSENDVLAVIGGRVPETELGQLEAHLDACSACRALVACAGSRPSSRADTLEGIPERSAGGTVPERIGRYRILRAVGSGGMGTVYAAQDPELDRVVAVKLLLPALAKSASAVRARVTHEAQAMARLAHPNVVTVHDIGSVGDQFFVAMELVDGGTLRSWLSAAPRDWRAVIAVLVAAGRGLAAAHAAGVVHRDFKPDNVLVGADGRVRVTDFGLAQLRSVGDDRVPEAPGDITGGAVHSLTGAGTLVGTPAYMAPEQLRGEAVDERSDIFSWCATAWEALYRERPFGGGDLVELGAAVNAGRLRPRPRRSKVPARLHEAIVCGLEPAPARRWSSMNALLEAIDAATRPTAFAGRARVAFGVAVVVLAAAGALLVSRAAPGPTPTLATARIERRALAVLDVIDAAAGRDGSLARLLTGRLAVELGAGAALRLVPADAARRAAVRSGLISGTAPTRDDLVRLRQALGADLVLWGQLRVEPNGSLQLLVELLDTATGGAAARVEVGGSEAELADVAAKAGESLRRQLGLRDVAADDLTAARKALPSSPEAAHLYAQGLELLARGDAGPAREALERALAFEPDQPMVLAALASAWKALEYDDRERDAARRAFEQAGGLPRELHLRIEAQYREALRDWGQAAAIWASLTTFFPDDLEYGLRLAAGLTRAGKLAEAQVRLDRLRQLAPPAGSDPRIDLGEGEVAAARGERDRALTAVERAGHAADLLHEDVLVARAHEQACTLLQDAGRFDDALAACRDGLARFESAGDRGGMARATASIAVLLVRHQKFDEARAPADRALALYREIGSQTGVANATSNIALAYAYVGDLTRAEQGLTEAVALYHEANERGRAAQTLHNLASVMTEQGKLREAERTYRQTIDETHALELRAIEALALANLAINLLRQGELIEARACAESAVALSRSIGNPRRLVFVLDTLGQLQLRMGRIDDARKALEEARAQNEKLGVTGAPIGQHLAELAEAEGDLEGAERLARQTVDDYRQKKMALAELYALTVHGRLLFRLGRTAEARQATVRERELAEQIGFDHVREEVAATLAQARAAAGEVTGAIADLQAAIARSESMHFIDASFEQRLVLARLEADHGQRAAARRVLAELEAEASKRGYQLLVRQIHSLRSAAAATRKAISRSTPAER